MHYSVIIPAWNEEAFIERTLSSIRAAMADVIGHDGELIVVDNNSTDATAELARAAGARVVFESINQIARARNAGAADSSGQALIFVDADTSCSAILLQYVLDALGAGRHVGGGSIIAPDRPIEATAERGLALWNWIARTRKLAAGCFVFCRRDAFEQVGGFSNKVFAGEEIFLSRALKRWGRTRGLRFEIVDVDPVITSVRKLDWYSPMRLARQAAIVLIPGALYSRRLCETWYDTRGRRDRS